MSSALPGRLWSFLTLYSSLAGIILLLSVSYYLSDSRLKLSALKQQEQLSISLQQSVIEHEVQSIISDLISLTTAFYPLAKDETYHFDMTGVKNIFLNILSNRNKYLSIQYISESGKDLTQGYLSDLGFPIIITKNRNTPTGLPTDFRNSINLNKAQLFISPIRLTTVASDEGEHSVPLTYFSTPVFNRSGQKSGVIVVAVEMSKILAKLAFLDSYSHGIHLITDHNGSYIVFREAKGEWQYSYANGLHMTLTQQYPLVASEIMNNAQGQIENEQGLFNYLTLHPFSRKNYVSSHSFSGQPSQQTHDYFWKSVTFVPAHILYKIQYPSLSIYLLSNGVVLIILAIICWFIADAVYQRRQAENIISQEREKFRTVADFTYDWEYWIDQNGCFIYISPSCQRISGYSVEQFKQKPELLIEIIHPDDLPRVAEHFDVSHLNDRICHVDFRIFSTDGEEIWIGHTSQPVYHDNGDFWGRRASNADITSRKQVELKLEQLAMHDELTQLPNRKLLYEQGAQILARAKRNNSSVGVLFIDLDNFKKVNDELGHAVGDTLLRNLANGMSDILRAGDILARVGGDEFIAILPDIDTLDSSRYAAHKLVDKVCRICATMTERTRLEDQYIGASIGISLYPYHANDIDSLIKVADEHMYQAKKAGKHGVV